MPASEQQRFFRQNLIGKSDAERKAFTQATMEAGERQDYVVRFTGQAGTEAYNATVKAAQAAKPSTVEQNNQQWISGNEMGRAGVQSARATAEELKDPGAAFAADMKDLVERDDKLLNRQGITNRGMWPFTLDKSKYSLYARNAERRKSQREAYFVLYRWQRFVAVLTPKLRSAIGDETLSLYDDYFARGYNGIVNEPAGLRHRIARHEDVGNAGSVPESGVFHRH